MLLGYILEVVKTPHVAEQYLVELFADISPAQITEYTKPGNNAFISLQQLARKKVAAFAQGLADCADDNKRPKGIVIANNRFTNLMSDDEQTVFCGVHYHGKTVAALAAEMDKPELTIRQLLKDSFTIIRNNRDTAAVHQ